MSYDAFVEGNRLAIVGQGLSAIPVELGREHGAQIERLDLSGNAITYAVLFSSIYINLSQIKRSKPAGSGCRSK